MIRESIIEGGWGEFDAEISVDNDEAVNLKNHQYGKLGARADSQYGYEDWAGLYIIWV